ncbi:MAG TPA: carboxypeptidase-like regulatory domain-containing protein [Thermoanaerobaculia bacterium]|nr:carboxypeptidase-like regulatory domain-containing protein [Thermoanaerobaculia bacterium]
MSVLLTLFLSTTLAAGTLRVEIDRNGFAGPLDVAVGTREETTAPKWIATRTLAAKQSSAAFEELQPGLFTVLVRGPKPLQRISTPISVGNSPVTTRLKIPRRVLTMQVLLGGKPLPNASLTLQHDALLWTTVVETDARGAFKGESWETARFLGKVWRDRSTAGHVIDVLLPERGSLTIDVPDRHVRGRVVDEQGEVIPNAVVILRTASGEVTQSLRTATRPDGTFEFFGVEAGAQILSARASSHLNSDVLTFELAPDSKTREFELALAHGEQQELRVVDSYGDGIAGATLIAACGGNVKSTAVTDATGRAPLATPSGVPCSFYALPREGSLAAAHTHGTVRVPEAASSLRLQLLTDANEPLSDVSLLMRVNGEMIPPAVGRQFALRGFDLTTAADGTVWLRRIPSGTYEFWPYRGDAEGLMLYELAGDMAAPITLTVKTGDNEAKIKLRKRL